MPLTALARPSTNKVPRSSLARWAIHVVHSPSWIVGIALLVRILYNVIRGCYRFPWHYWNGMEMAVLGRWMALGEGFKLGIDYPPSAWTAPLYPCVAALAFRVLGDLSHAAVFALLVFNSIFAALTCWTIYRIAQRVFNETTALWSAWIWALLPSSIYFSTHWIWETATSAFLLSLLLLITLKMEGDNRLLAWCGYGFLWGMLALTNTAAVSWLPFSGCWLAFRLHRQKRVYLLPVVAASVVFWATLTPWMVRNYVVFGTPLLRGDFGAELRAGNNPMAQGWWVSDYTYNNPVLLKQYKQMGEPAYVSTQGRLAREWIAQHPRRFLTVCFYRFLYFWGGLPHQGRDQVENYLFTLASLLSFAGLALAIRRRLHGIFLFASLLLFYPMTYYITFPTPRYRHAIEPEMLLLSVFLMASAWTAITAKLRPACKSDSLL